MTQNHDHEIEIERLKSLLKRREAQLMHAYDWRYEKELELQDLKHQLAETTVQAQRLENEAKSRELVIQGYRINGEVPPATRSAK